MFWPMEQINTQPIIGAVAQIGDAITQLFADISSLGGEVKTKIQKQASHTWHTLDAACYF